ncbi:MAG: hypothetical protein GY928_28505 [Colwellia sp.]|nr:hypothetical protein [Colwellia sp.]
MNDSDFDLGRERLINDLKAQADYWERLSERLESEAAANFYYGAFVGVVVTGLCWFAWWIS